MNAAIPDYIGNNFSDAPPGHKFGLYFPIWNGETWEMEDRSKTEVLKKTVSIPTASRQQIEAIRSRQFALVSSAPETTRLTLEALSTSPMVTGMGMEHPLENGFAFLNPYGLPYLPGSSIKGVLRQAAIGLGWDDEVISVLFGREVAAGDTKIDHTRGALTFWDAIPELAGNTLGMDVMTPHYGDYYQGTSSPHDAGSPNPVVFMVVPPQSQFSFHITADQIRLKEVSDWRVLVQCAFGHAFKWLGFGAKTAVGYGAMLRDQRLEKDNADKLDQLVRDAETAAMTDEERKLQVLRNLLEADQESNLKQAGAQVVSELATLLQVGKNWEHQQRLQLAELAETIYNWHGWGPKKKRPAKVEALMQLRSG